MTGPDRVAAETAERDEIVAVTIAEVRSKVAELLAVTSDLAATVDRLAEEYHVG